MVWPEELLNGFPASISLPSTARLTQSRLAPAGVPWPYRLSRSTCTISSGLNWWGPGARNATAGTTSARLPRSGAWRNATLCRHLSICARWRAPSWRAGLRRVPLLAPLAPHRAPQLALVPIEPQEASFEYSPIRLDVGAVAAAATPAAPEAPPLSAPRAKLRIEENFDAGLGQWVGDLSEWKVDAAGAHTGALALFAPSAELIDYDFEFLARMEGHSLTWVFRAEEMTDYYAASVAIAADGNLVFHRWSVTRDVAGARVSKPLAIRLRSHRRRRGRRNRRRVRPSLS